MKTIVFDISSAVPVSGVPTSSGIGRTTFELIQALVKCRDTLPFQLRIFAHRLKNLPFGSTQFGSNIQQLRLPRWELFYRLTRALPVVEWQTKADLFHSPHNFANVCRLDRVVLTIHDAMYFTYPEAHLHDPKEAELMVHSAKYCRAIITCSESSKRDILKYVNISPDKIHVIPWGYNCGIFYPEKDQGSLKARLRIRHGFVRDYFLATSCNTGRKRSDYLLKEYLILLRDNPQNDMVMLWRNPPARIKNIILDNKLSPRIHLLNNVTDEELRDLYCGATALFFPSVYEGFGLPVLEAMACGTPVVTTCSSSLPEVGGDAALYISTENNDELLEIMRAFENGNIKINEISQKGLSRATSFNWDNCAQQTIKVYSECLGL